MNTLLLNFAAQCYDLQPEHLQPLHGGNFSHVYGFTRDDVAYVLRITPPNADLDAAAMCAIWAWVHYLDAHGARVAGPIPSRAGRLVETCEQEAGRYLVTAVKQAPGILAERLPFAQWNDALFAAWGRAAGKMHAIAQQYAPDDPAHQRLPWDQAGNCFNEPLPADWADSVIAQRYAQAREFLPTLPVAAEHYGMIHADFHAANFCVEPETARITVFDFDDCARGWYIMDVAMALFDMLVVYPRADRAAFAAHFLRQFLAGYVPEKPLTAFWAAQLPHFLKLLEINLYVQVSPYYDPADTSSWVGKFMAGDRKRRIEADVPYVDVDFVAVLESVQG